MSEKKLEYFVYRILEVVGSVMEHSKELTDETVIRNISVLPFIEAFGYNTRNPHHMVLYNDYVPRSEQQDNQTVYVLLDKKEKPAFFVCIRSPEKPLYGEQPLQLSKYFENTAASFAFITDGINYEFYSRVVSQHYKGDGSIALLRLNSIDDYVVKQLHPLTRRAYNPVKMGKHSCELSYFSEVQANLDILHRWALVAVLSRIVRRTLPVYYLIVGDRYTGAKEGVAWLWLMASEATAVFDYNKLIQKVGYATRTGFSGDWMAGHMLANGAKLVAESIIHALHASHSDNFAKDALRSIKKARTSVSQAVDVTRHCGSSSTCEIDENAKDQYDNAIIIELREMVSLSKNKNYNNTTPVDPSVLGKLWRNGAPKTWPSDLWLEDLQIAPTPEQLADSRSIFQSCFISYSHADKEFANKLHKSLSDAGIRCWLDEKNILPGAEIHEEIDKAIRRYDRVIICCSRTSLTESWWVNIELDRAFEKERQVLQDTGERFKALIPIDLDGFIFTRECKFYKARDILSRRIANFNAWKDPEQFNDSVKQIIRSLEPVTQQNASPDGNSATLHYRR